MEKNTKKNAYARVYVHDRPLSRVQLFATSRTVACQAPLSMEFPRQEYCCGLSFPSPGDLPNPGIKPMSPVLAGGFFTTEPNWDAPSLTQLVTNKIKTHRDSKY